MFLAYQSSWKNNFFRVLPVFMLLIMNIKKEYEESNCKKVNAKNTISRDIVKTFYLGDKGLSSHFRRM